jgi:hypothetical protein
MSRTYRADKESRIAERRMPRDREGNIVLPRIVVRKPRPGDVHPIKRRQLRQVLDRVPLKYMYNLSKVEMLPRKDGIGAPFGYYLPSEKRIALYSLPLKWELIYGDELGAELAGPFLHLEEHGAVVDTDENIATVIWPYENRMALWLCREVLLHELGHHFRATYRAKRRAGFNIKNEDEEFFADQKSFDLFPEVFPKAARAFELARQKRRKGWPERRKAFSEWRKDQEEGIYLSRNPTDRHKLTQIPGLTPSS